MLDQAVRDFSGLMNKHRKIISKALVSYARELFNREDIVAVQMSRYNYRIDTVGILFKNGEEYEEQVYCKAGWIEFSPLSEKATDDYVELVCILVNKVENYEDAIAILWPDGSPIMFDPNGVYENND